MSVGLLCDLLCGQVLFCAVANQGARQRPATLKAHGTAGPLHEAATALQCVPVFLHPSEYPPSALSDCVGLRLRLID